MYCSSLVDPSDEGVLFGVDGVAIEGVVITEAVGVDERLAILLVGVVGVYIRG